MKREEERGKSEVTEGGHPVAHGVMEYWSDGMVEWWLKRIIVIVIVIDDETITM